MPVYASKGIPERKSFLSILVSSLKRAKDVISLGGFSCGFDPCEDGRFNGYFDASPCFP